MITTTRRALALLGWFVVASVSVPGAFSASAESVSMASSYFVYVGTYTGPDSKGIYGYRYDPATGKFTSTGLAAEVKNPAFLASDPTHRFLYAVSEIGNDGRSHGAVSSFAIDPSTGVLKFLNKVDSGGGGACHLMVDNTGRMLFVANYGTGNVTSFAINADGSIGEQTGVDQHTGSGPSFRQKGPHAHAVVVAPDNRFLFVPDLGTDQIKIYRVDAEKRTFTPNDPPFASVKAGLGPRHFMFGPGAKFAYVLCEMESTVAVFSYDPVKGSLAPVETISTLPPDYKGIDNSAELGIDPSGRFLYASNRGHDSIAVFAIDPDKGTLTRVQVAPSLGKIPRNFAIDPTGKYVLVANQISNQMVVFAIDQTNGQLKATGQTLDMVSPVAILFVPAQ